MTKPIDVVVIGTIIKETIVYPDKEIGPVIGSPAAYSALVMAAQGKNIGMVCYYGHDMDDVISELDALDKRGWMDYEYTTRNRLIYREDGTKYVEYVRSAPDLKFEDIHPDYLNCQFFKICPMNYEVDLDVVKKLHAMGKTVFVDLGGYGGATTLDRRSIHTEFGKNVIDTICNNCTIVKASEEDLQSIIPGKTAEEAAEYLIANGAKTVVITLGGKGALWKIGDADFQYIKPFHAISEAEDGSLNFTGAGDSFGAGFMASYSQYQDVPKAVLNGNATASIVIQRPGGCFFDRMPTADRVAARAAEKV